MHDIEKCNKEIKLFAGITSGNVSIIEQPKVVV